MKSALTFPRTRKFLPLSLFAALVLGCAALIASATLFDAPASAQGAVGAQNTKVVVTSVTPKPTGLEISWQPPAFPLPIMHYSIIRSVRGTLSNDELIAHDVDGLATSYLDTLSGVPMEHLISPVSWTYQVRATFALRLGGSHTGQWSEPYSVTGLLPKPVGPAMRASLRGDDYTFSVGWTPPSLSWSDQGTIGLTGYIVYRTKQHVETGIVGATEVVQDTNANTISYTRTWSYQELINSLERHLFSVRAKYGVFFSEVTDVVQVPAQWP